MGWGIFSSAYELDLFYKQGRLIARFAPEQDRSRAPALQEKQGLCHIENCRWSVCCFAFWQYV